MWKPKNDAEVEYSRATGVLLVSMCILKIKCNHVDLVVARSMSHFFVVKILLCIACAFCSALAFF